ncbi:MAG TPA: flagellar biosynthesis anti-sigma factor FlgM [Burkholderiaceae bacterium]
MKIADSGHKPIPLPDTSKAEPKKHPKQPIKVVVPQAQTAKVPERQQPISLAPQTAVNVAAKPAPEASAQLALSSTATKLLQATANDNDSFDAEKVDRIAKAIAEGKFSINAESIADKLISNAQELVARNTPH